ncbi:MAG: phage head closure protein [Pseudomonadota bacterium]
MNGPVLPRKLTLETPERTSDGAGGHTIAWTPLGVVWAEMEPRRGSETVVAGANASRQAWRITVRGAPNGSPQRPRADQRFTDGTRVFNILAVAEADSEGRFLICNAEEGLAV